MWFAALFEGAIATLEEYLERHRSMALSNLIISEYVEGSSFNKAIELFNGTSADVDLGEYRLQFFFNGNSTPSTTISLSGVLASGEVYVVADDGAAPEVLAATDLAATPNFFNGDDAVVLFQGETVVDSLGQVGFDPGSEWGAGNTSTANSTLRRSTTVMAGDTDISDAFDPAAEWEGFATDSFDDLGSYAGSSDGGNGGGDDGGGGGETILISAVQGSGDESPLVGQSVTVEAIVVGDYQDGTGANGDLNGFYIQEEDADSDGDFGTSEGLFIFDGSSPAVDVVVGDRVQVTGTVTEFNGLTELTEVSVAVVDAGNALPTAATVSFPVASVNDLEAYEGMQVAIPDTLFVTEYFNLDRFGEVVLSSDGESNAPGTDGRLDQYTQFNAPSVEGFAAYEDAIAKRRIVLDDGQTVQNPSPIIYGRGGESLSASNTLRGGDTVNGLTGVLTFGFGDYRIQPTGPVDFQPTNPRPLAPEAVDGDLKVVSFNVLNFFTTLDVAGNPGSGPNGLEPRGADSQAEFDRQLEKLVTALETIDGDIVGLIELENEFGGDQNGDGQYAIDTLVTALNNRVGAGTYAFVEPGTPFVDSGDAISVGAIYKTSTVRVAEGSTVEVLRDSDLPSLGLSGTLFDGPSTNRAPLAATFEEIATGEKLTVAVNHFKSKGGSGSGDDADVGDGQGNFNGIRTRAAEALDAWLSTDPTGSGDEDFLIIGDLNAYAQEDPITLLESRGYQNVVENPEAAYSFVFDGQFGTLDYGLANSTLISQVTGATEWHVNADEPDALDYNLDFGRDPSLFEGSVPFRNSDHDPLIIGLDLASTQADVIEGTDGEDTLRGTSEDEVIRGFGSRDRLFGLAGNDVIEGGDGDDLLFGGGGADTLIGEMGKDRLFGGGGDDLLEGGEGSDRLFGGAGDDVLVGGAGSDLMVGGAGSDVAVLSGVQADYQFTGSARRLVAASDLFGRDRIIGTEFIAFDNETVAVADLF